MKAKTRTNHSEYNNNNINDISSNNLVKSPTAAAVALHLSASGDQVDHHSFVSVSHQAQSKNTASMTAKSKNNRTLSTDDDGDQSISQAYDGLAMSSYNTVSHQLAAHLSLLKEKCLRETVYHHSNYLSLNNNSKVNSLFTTTATESSQIRSATSCKHGSLSATLNNKLPNPHFSGFQCYDPFESLCDVNDSSQQQSQTVHSECAKKNKTTKLGSQHSQIAEMISTAIKDESQSAASRNMSSTLQQENSTESQRPQMNNRSRNRVTNGTASTCLSTTAPEHNFTREFEVADVFSYDDMSSAISAPIKVVFHPRENRKSSQEALQSPRAKDSLPWIDNWAMKSSDSASNNLNNLGGEDSDGHGDGASNATALPPSPPLSRKHAVHAGSPTAFGSSNHEMYVELLTQYNSLKEQLHVCEEGLKNYHGRQYSDNELKSNVEYRNLITQLAKVRNRLKDWKSDPIAFCENLSSGGEKENSKENVSADDGGKREKLQNMRRVMKASLDKLSNKRRMDNRPFDIDQMSDVEIKIEKEQTQKELLAFEKLFGRAKSSEERHIVTELYDRYRDLKKIVKSVSASSLHSFSRRSVTTPLTVESDITDVNSDFGDTCNSSMGGGRASEPFEVQNNSPHVDRSVANLTKLEAEKMYLLERKRDLSRSVNSPNRSGNSYKQQTDVNDLKKVKTRLKVVEQLLTNHNSNHD